MKILECKEWNKINTVYIEDLHEKHLKILFLLFKFRQQFAVEQVVSINIQAVNWH